MPDKPQPALPVRLDGREYDLIRLNLEDLPILRACGYTCTGLAKDPLGNPDGWPILVYDRLRPGGQEPTDG